MPLDADHAHHPRVSLGYHSIAMLGNRKFEPLDQHSFQWASEVFVALSWLDEAPPVRCYSASSIEIIRPLSAPRLERLLQLSKDTEGPKTRTWPKKDQLSVTIVEDGVPVGCRFWHHLLFKL